MRTKTLKRLCGGAMALLLCLAPAGVLAAADPAADGIVAEEGAPQAETVSLSVAIEGSAQLHMLAGDTWAGIAPGEDTADLPLGEDSRFQVHVDDGQTLSSVTVNGSPVDCEAKGLNVWSFTIPDVQGDCVLVVTTVPVVGTVSLSVAIEGGAQLHMLVGDRWQGVAAGQDTANLIKGDSCRFQVHVNDGETLSLVTLNGRTVACEAQAGNVWTFAIPDVQADCALTITAIPADVASLSVFVEGGAQLHMLVGDRWQGVAPGEDTAELRKGESCQFEAHVDEGETLASVTLNGDTVPCQAQAGNVWTFTIPDVQTDCVLVVTTSPQRDTASLSVSIEGSAQLHMLDGGKWVGVAPGQDTADLAAGGTYQFEVHVDEGGTLVSVTLNSSLVACEAQAGNVWTFTIPDVRQDCELAIATTTAPAETAPLGVSVSGGAHLRMLVDGYWVDVAPGSPAAQLPLGKAQAFLVRVDEGETLGSVALNGSPVECELALYGGWTFTIPAVQGACSLAVRAVPQEAAPFSLSVDGDATVRMLAGGSWQAVDPGRDTADLMPGEDAHFEVEAAEDQILTSASWNGRLLSCTYRGRNRWVFDIEEVEGPGALGIVTQRGEAGESVWLSLRVDGTCDVQLRGADGEWVGVPAGAQAALLETGSAYEMRVVAMEDQFLVSAATGAGSLPFEREASGLEDRAVWRLELPLVTGAVELDLKVESREGVRSQLAAITSASPRATYVGVPIPEAGQMVDVELEVETDADSVAWCLMDSTFQYHILAGVDGRPLTGRRQVLHLGPEDLLLGVEATSVQAVAITDGWLPDDPDAEDIVRYLDSFGPAFDDQDGCLGCWWTIWPERARFFPELDACPGSGLSIGRDDGYVTGLTLADASQNTEGTVLPQFVHCIGTQMSVADAQGALLGASTPIGTGCRVRITEQDAAEPARSATFVVAGDVLGTGRMTLAQVVRLADAIKGSRALEGPYMAAADFNGDGTLGISDLVAEAALFRRATSVAL